MKSDFAFSMLSLVFFVASAPAYSAPTKSGEGIIQDPITGNFLATYWDEDETGGEFVTATLENATKIAPLVKSAFVPSSDGAIKYSYRLRNGGGAQQGIVSFRLSGLAYEVQVVNSVHFGSPDSTNKVDVLGVALSSPAKWIGSGAKVTRLQKINLGWSFDLSDIPLDESKIDYLDGIRPGSSLEGFGLLSSELPGIIAAQLKGNVGWGGNLGRYGSMHQILKFTSR